jgi:hypothetical protein
MSEVARQYNLIGETLRTGIQGMMDSAMQSKALDIRAQQVGADIEQSQFKQTMELNNYRMQREQHDKNMKLTNIALRKANAEEAIAKVRQKSWNGDATLLSSGIDTPTEDGLVRAKMGKFNKHGFDLRMDEKGQEVWYEGDRKLTEGELASNADFATLMADIMDLDMILTDNHKLESEKAEMIQLKLQDAIENGSPEIDMYRDQLKMQKERIGQIEGVIADKAAKPIKYLNNKINTIYEFIGKAKNPKALLPIGEALIAERNAELKLYEERMKAAGKKHNWKYFPVYDKNNKQLTSIAVVDGQDPRTSKVFQNYQSVSLGEDPMVKQQQVMATKFAETEAGVGELISAQQKGGVPALAAKWREYYNAAGLSMPYQPMEEATNHFLSWGKGPQDSPDDR